MAKSKTPTKKKEPKHLDRDEFELEEMAYTLIDVIERKKTKAFTFHKREEPLTGTVTKMDANTKLIHIKDKYMNIHKVHFLDILKISDIDY
ncbi:YolD-like family protein [Lysinibacillus fusiformis]|uniref:YolD-like family protein n=1 Tax=Lysinibacillus fusiformis TaxID=28031 RepID=UPI002E1CCF31|nr:YolD-like family protein [Lysinibacillus fusiformis]